MTGDSDSERGNSQGDDPVVISRAWRSFAGRDALIRAFRGWGGELSASEPEEVEEKTQAEMLSERETSEI